MKKNTPGFGKDYEYLVPALFALKLNAAENVKDFSIRSNAKGFENFDDVVIHIKLMNNTDMNYAIQLKHKDGKLLPTNFEAKGDFNLEKYCEAHKKLNQKKSNIHLILFTCATFDINKMNEVPSFTMDYCDHESNGNVYFNTSNSSTVFKFEINQTTPSNSKNDYRNFFGKFSLYTDQKNYEEFQVAIQEVLKNEETARAYEDLFRKWHSGSFTNKTIDRETINIHIIDMFSSGFIIADRYFFSGNRNITILRKLIEEFDVTLVNDDKNFLDSLGAANYENYKNLKSLGLYLEKYKINTIQADPSNAMTSCILRLAKEYKFTKKKDNLLKDEVRIKIILYFFEKLVPIYFDSNSETVIYQMLKLYQANNNNKVSFIFLGQNCNTTQMLHKYKILHNVGDILQENPVLYKKIIQECKLSLQGKAEITLESLINSYGEIRSLIEVKQLFSLLQNTLTVEKIEENLPTCYIPRQVSTYLLELETVFHLAQSKNYILIINFSDYFDKIYPSFLTKNIKVADIEQFVEEKDYPVLYKTYNDYYLEIMEKLSHKRPSKNICILKMVTENKFLLLKIRENIHDLKPYVCQSEPIKEKKIHEIFNSNVNILVAQPGMGKSTMMTFLRDNCAQDTWAIKVNLKTHNSFLKKQRSANDLLGYFLELGDPDKFATKLKLLFLRKHKITIFLDGLDELDNVCIDNVLKCVEHLANLGVRIWISLRENLQNRVEQELGQFGINIIELDDKQQKSYVSKRLQNYPDKEINKIVEDIIKNKEVVNNKKILGAPLQLYIITELFLQNNQTNIIDDMFILTKLYKTFFIGRYNHSFKKYESQYDYATLGTFEEHLENYEIAALYTLFDAKVLAKMKLDLRKYSIFLKRIKDKKDILGIIIQVNKEEKAVFQHQTFAEYFACVFLCNNFDKARILEEYLFSDEYKDLMLMFNIMLAENNPLHLAIVHKNTVQIKKYMDDNNIFDKGKRTPLHVYTICGRNNESSILSIQETFRNSKKAAAYVIMERSNRKYQEIVRSLVMKYISYRKDDVFNKDILYFALIKQDLFLIETIIEYDGINYETIENFKNFNIVSNPYVAFAATLVGDLNLLSVTLNKRNSLIKEYLDDSLWSVWYALETLYENNISKELSRRVVEILKIFGFSITAKEFRSIVVKNNISLVELILEKFSMAHLDSLEKSSLIHELEQNGFEKMKELLLQNGFQSTVNQKIQPVHQTWNMSTKLVFSNCYPVSIDLSLHEAVTESDLNRVKSILETMEVPIDARNYDGHTPLQLAAMKGNCEIFHLLLENGANPYIRNTKDRRIVHYLATSGHCNLLESFSKTIKEKDVKLFEEAFDIDARDIRGRTPLMLAAKKGLYEMCYLLLVNGAHPNKCDKYGYTMFHYATLSRNTELIESLLSNNWKIDGNFVSISTQLLLIKEIINAKINSGRTPIMAAAKNGCYKTCHLFLEYGANIKIVDVNKRTILHFAVMGGNTELIELMLQTYIKVDCDGAEDLSLIRNTIINVKDKDGITPLMLAAEKGYYSMCKMLLENGARLDTNDDKNRRTIFHYAAMGGSTELIYTLLESVNEIDSKDKYNKTPLDYAVIGQHDEACQLLLPKSDVKSLLNYMEFVLCLKSYESIIDLMIEKCSTSKEKSKFLSEVIKSGNEDLTHYVFHRVEIVQDIVLMEQVMKQSKWQKFLELLISKGFSMNFEDKTIKYYDILTRLRLDKIKFLLENQSGQINFVQLFLKAAVSKNFDLLKYCLKQGVDVNATDNNGETTLYKAAKVKDFDKMNFLIMNGADPNSAKEYQINIWAGGIERSDINFIKMIIEKNANPNVQNKEGETPLYLAVKRNNQELVDLLIRGGADPNVVERNPLLLALRKQDEKMAALLMERDANLDNFKALLAALDTDNSDFIKKFTKLIYRNYGFKEKTSLFFASSRKGNWEVINYLLRQNFDVNTTNEERETALLIAAKHKKFDIVKYLILKGADVNSISTKKETIWRYLHFFDNNLKKIILSKRVDLNLIDGYGRTPLCYAIRNEDIYTTTHLLNNKDGINLPNEILLGAIVTNNVILWRVLEQKTDFLKRKNTVDVQTLINHRLELFSKFKEQNKTPALHHKTNNVKMVLKEINEAEDRIYRMLHFAVYSGDLLYAEELIDNHIDLENVDKYNEFYPLHFATENGVLTRELLLNITGFFNQLYDSKLIWKLTDMRRYILASYPRDPRTCKKKRNYIYLTEEFKLMEQDYGLII